MLNTQKRTYGIKFLPTGDEVDASEGLSLMDAAREAGLVFTSEDAQVIIESGVVRCVNPVHENKYPVSDTYPLSDLVVALPEDVIFRVSSLHQKIEGLNEAEPVGKSMGLAVKLGITSVSACMVDLTTKKIIGSESIYNKQSAYGADILSRIDYVERNGVESLNRLAINSMNDLIGILKGDRSYLEVKKIIVSGPPTMTYILLDRDPLAIIEDSRDDQFKESSEEDAELFRINCAGRMYTVPGVSGYVGGDLVAAILASGIHTRSEVSMIIDVSTSGGVVIGNDQFLIAASSFAGPGMEGGDVSAGMPLTEGAITDFVFDKRIIKFKTQGGIKPLGISPRGLMNLVAELSYNKVIDKKGSFISDYGNRVQDSPQGKAFVAVYAEDTLNGVDIQITEQDIKKILASKASLYAAAKMLCSEGIDFCDLDTLYVSGDFGTYFPMEQAVALGLIPDIPRNKFRYLGNGGLRGACMILLDEGKRKEADLIARKTSYYELQGLEGFTEEYLRSAVVGL